MGKLERKLKVKLIAFVSTIFTLGLSIYVKIVDILFNMLGVGF